MSDCYLCWVVKLIVAVPVILILRKLHFKYVFPRLLSHFMKRMHAEIEARKKKLFEEGLKELETKQEENLEVLEIGVGCGENFKYFPRNSNVHVLDKTDDFLPFLAESFKKNGREDLKISNLIVARGECMKKIESESMDIVVHTFILCSVDEPQKVLAEIYRVLKPGGICVFIEHSLDKTNFLRGLIQKLIGPIWRFFCDCKFLPMNEIISNKGKYDSTRIKDFNYSGYLANPIIFGFGKKNL